MSDLSRDIRREISLADEHSTGTARRRTPRRTFFQGALEGATNTPSPVIAIVLWMFARAYSPYLERVACLAPPCYFPVGSPRCATPSWDAMMPFVHRVGAAAANGDCYGATHTPADLCDVACASALWARRPNGQMTKIPHGGAILTIGGKGTETGLQLPNGFMPG
jgi:hypothetical protein